MSKQFCFRTPFDSHHANTAKICMAAPLSYFLITKIELKMFLLVISEILGLFVNTLTADDKYSLCNKENLL